MREGEDKFMKKKTGGEKIFDYTVNVLLIIVAVICIYPIWYVLIASVSSPTAIGNGEVILWPKGFNWNGYTRLMENKNIWRGYRNSILYTIAGTAVDFFVQIPVAYALSRKSLPGHRVIMALFVFTMYFGGGIIPTYLLINSLGMINSPIALIIPSCVSVFNIIVAKSFFEGNVPDSLYDAARMDGCGYTRFFVRVVLPLSPALLAIIALYSIQRHWNVYLNAEMYLIAAEAAAELCDSPSDTWGQKAYAHIESLHYRARTSVAPEAPQPKWETDRFSTKEELVAAVMWERVYEMYGEGHEWFDTHRRGVNWFLTNIIRPFNESLQQKQQQEMRVWYGETFLFPEDPDEIRKGLFNAFPENELIYNTALDVQDQNIYIWN